ncbi:MAG: fumarate hydratase C-terminal domain-containing protein [Candidatus Muiribacteriota bacterium]
MNKLKFPLNQNDFNKFSKIKDNQHFYLSGFLYVMRDRAHKLYIENNENVIDFENSAIFYAGPTDSGVFGPTTSARMDPYTEYFAEKGVKLFIGKGNRDNKLLETLRNNYDARYAVTFGGLASYLTKCVISSEVLLFPDLGCEAIYKIEVKNLPVIFI